MIVVSAEAAVGGDSDDWRQRGSRDGAVHAMRQRRIILDGRGEEKGRGSQDVNRCSKREHNMYTTRTRTSNVRALDQPTQP